MLEKIVIPTPVECKFTGKKIKFTGFKVENHLLSSPYALEIISALIRDSGSGKLDFTALKHENKQAYKINLGNDGITVQGASDIAFIYAMTTLFQLAEIKGGEIILPEGEIFDYPKFEIRGVNWNLFVECRGWSQDAGDGMDAFIERFINGLDILAFFKLNAVFVDGFGWNKERFPGYGDLMCRLNREARRRGIKLIFGGYNAGYGAQWFDFDGPVFHNRKFYPDGEIYSCIGSSEASNKMGTCLSNLELLEEKKKNLIEFVKAVEPGMLYIHGLDISRQDAAEKAWADRCPECRKRWPNDTINAADGMAGAFAKFYDDLYEAVSSVKNQESGYDAAMDCVVSMVSPNYTSYTENDAEWKYHLDYFRTLTGCLKNKNIYLTLREQFFNSRTGKPRFRQLRKAVEKNAKLSVVYFSSGSSFYNSLPITADAACIRYFEGMNVVVAGSGNAFQEPRQMVYAEYMWKPENSRFSIELPERSSKNKLLPYYHDLTGGRSLPDAVFGKNGIIEIACEKLYGKDAAGFVAGAIRPEAVSGFPPELQKAKSLVPLMPLTNELLPGYHFSVFYSTWKGKKVYWHDELSHEIMEYAKSYEKLMPHFIQVTEKAAAAYRQAASRCNSQLPLNPEMRVKHLERMANTCSTAVSMLSLTRRWLQIFIEAYCNVRKSPDKRIQLPIKKLEEDLNLFLRKLKEGTGNTTDPYGGDSGQAVRTIEFILKDISNIKYTLETGKYLEVKRDRWW